MIMAHHYIQRRTEQVSVCEGNGSAVNLPHRNLALGLTFLNTGVTALYSVNPYWQESYGDSARHTPRAL